MKRILKRLINRYTEQCWALGFVRGGMQTIMESDHMEVDWIKMPKDRWFADPFVLDVTKDEILLLVEDFGYDIRKGVISLLHINRATMEIVSRKVLLEQPTHLSFPSILRKDGHIYIYPENAQGGRLDMYEYYSKTETLSFVKTICDDAVWDSIITDYFGDPLLFTASWDDYHFDIYRWNEKQDRYISSLQITGIAPDMRMGGDVFQYNDSLYYPAQDNRRTYGGAIDIKRIDYVNGAFSFETIKHIESPSKQYTLGLHTVNEYKGVVVIDVKGYRYGWIGSIVNQIAKLKNIITL